MTTTEVLDSEWAEFNNLDDCEIELQRAIDEAEDAAEAQAEINAGLLDADFKNSA